MDDQDDIHLDNEGLDDSVLAEEHAGNQVKKLKEKLKEAEGKAKADAYRKRVTASSC